MVTMVARKRTLSDSNIGRKEVNAMRYETPVLRLVGPASLLVLGVKPGPVDRLPESDLRKGDDIIEGLDE